MHDLQPGRTLFANSRIAINVEATNVLEETTLPFLFFLQVYLNNAC